MTLYCRATHAATFPPPSQDKWGGSVDSMRIVHRGRAWENTATLSEMGVDDGGSLHVVLPMN